MKERQKKEKICSELYTLSHTSGKSYSMTWKLHPMGSACALENSLVSKDEVLWPPMCAVVRIIEKA